MVATATHSPPGDAVLSAYSQTFSDKLVGDKSAGPKDTKVPVGLLAQIRPPKHPCKINKYINKKRGGGGQGTADSQHLFST